jgi:hypothetical protein
VAWVRPRQDLVLENLLLRHHHTVLTRPTRTRLFARLRAWDKPRSVLARGFCAGWREHLAIGTPDMVSRWHGRAGVCPGAGSPARVLAARGSAPKCRT